MTQRCPAVIVHTDPPKITRQNILLRLPPSVQIAPVRRRPLSALLFGDTVVCKHPLQRNDIRRVHVSCSLDSEICRRPVPQRAKGKVAPSRSLASTLRQQYRFDFSSAEKPYETYSGLNARLRYFVRITVSARGRNVTQESDFVVQNIQEVRTCRPGQTNPDNVALANVASWPAVMSVHQYPIVGCHGGRLAVTQLCNVCW